MEFIFRLPQDIDKNGAFWQIWNSFCQKLKFFQNTELHGSVVLDTPSLLLFAAHDQVSSICSSLKMYDLDLPKLNEILQVVEQACLPYFILLFERFRYFSLKQEPSDSLDDFVVVLRKQAEVCEFGNLKDSIMTNALCSSVKSESLVQHLSSTAGHNFDDVIDHYNRAKRSHSSIKDVHTSENGLDILCQFSADECNSKVEDTCYAEVIAYQNKADHSVVHTERGRHNYHSVHKKKVGKLPEICSWKTINKARHTRVEKSKSVENKQTPTASNIDNNKSDDILLETGAVWNMKSSSTMITKRVETKFYCCFCEKTFAGQNCMRKHFVSKHNGCTQFPCKVCTTAFVSVDAYLLHYQREHFVQQQRSVPPLKLKVNRSTERFSCYLCKRVFVQEGYLKRHIHYSHAKHFLCWNCGENCQSLSDYKLHSEKHEAIGRFSCDLCQRQHNNIFRLVGHLKNHMMPRNKCEICGVIFIKQESLAKHIEKHVDEPVHKCKICGKSFVVKSRMHHHMKIHSGEKRFTCEVCGKTYAQKVTLVHHKRWHTGEQPFACEICGKRTRCSGDLIKHKRKHSDKYSYVCEVCGRGFNYRSALVKHRMGHTGKRAYACEVCGRTFIYREGLRDHIKASRCPGRKSESSYSRTPRATKLLQAGISNNLMDVESKVFGPAHSQRAPDTSPKDTQDWHCMLKNNETDEGTSVVLVPSYY